MGRRPFSLIRKADELKAALTKYEDWSKLDAAQKQASYVAQKGQTKNPKTARRSIIGYIMPFGVAKAENTYIQSNIPDAEGVTADPPKTEPETSLIQLVRTKVITEGKFATIGAKPTGTILGRRTVPMSRLARVTAIDIGSPAENQIKSRITGRPYSYRKRNAVSCPFGQSDTIEDFGAAKLAIATAIPSSATRAVYFRVQGDVDVAFVTA